MPLASTVLEPEKVVPTRLLTICTWGVPADRLPTKWMPFWVFDETRLPATTSGTDPDKVPVFTRIPSPPFPETTLAPPSSGRMDAAEASESSPTVLLYEELAIETPFPVFPWIEMVVPAELMEM